MELVTLLGVRGSVPVSGTQFQKYGGATSSFCVEMGGELILIDGGTGLMNLPVSVSDVYTHTSLLLTHPHADHLSGIPMSPIGFRSGFPITIYGAERGGFSAEQQLKLLISPPLWPVTLDSLPAVFSYGALPSSFSIGSVQVTVMEGVHPGGVSLFRLESTEHSVVIATDCTFTERIFPEITAFAQNCDLLLCDGQYFDSEWPHRSTFGHNTWRSAAALGAACHAKQTRIIHHDPWHTDSQLDQESIALCKEYTNCQFGYEGEKIYL